MKVITVRDTNGILICFGPAETGYDPSVPVGAIRASEDSYDVVMTEYAALQAQLPAVETIEQKVASLQDQVATLNLSAGVLSGVKTS